MWPSGGKGAGLLHQSSSDHWSTILFQDWFFKGPEGNLLGSILQAGCAG